MTGHDRPTARVPILASRVSPQGGRVAYPAEFADLSRKIDRRQVRSDYAIPTLREQYGPAFTEMSDGHLDDPTWIKRAIVATLPILAWAFAMLLLLAVGYLWGIEATR